MSSHHGSASPRQGYASSVVSNESKDSSAEVVVATDPSVPSIVEETAIGSSEWKDSGEFQTDAVWTDTPLPILPNEATDLASARDPPNDEATDFASARNPPFPHFSGIQRFNSGVEPNDSDNGPTRDFLSLTNSRHCEGLLDSGGNKVLRMPKALIRLLAMMSTNVAEDDDNIKVRIAEFPESDDEIQTESLSQLTASLNLMDKWITGYVHRDALEYLGLLHDFIVLVHSLCVVEDSRAIRPLVMMFFRAQGVGVIESNLLSFLVKPFIKSHTAIKTQMLSVPDLTKPLSEQLDSLGDLLEYVFDSAFADACKNVIIACAVLKFTDSHTAFRIFEIFGKRPSGTLFDITKGAIKSLAIIVKAAEDIKAGKEDLQTILFAKDRWVMARQSFATLNFQRTKIRMGAIKPDDGLFDRQGWLFRAIELKTYLERKLKKTSQAKSMYLDISNMVTSLDTWLSDVRAAAGALYRMTPFGISISGSPGIGKSSIVDMGAASWCRVRGITFSPEMIYHRPTASKFMDGLKSQPVGHWSEIGADSIEIAKKQREEAAKELTSVVDSLPMISNQAAVDDKGTKYVSLECVIVDTNVKDMGYPLNCRNPSAFLRRFRHVTARVKQQFLKDGSPTALDANKVKLAKCHPSDLWWFTVEEVVVEDNDKFSLRPEMFVDRKGNSMQAIDLDVFDYTYAMEQFMEAHIIKENAVIERKKSGVLFDAHKYTCDADYKRAHDIAFERPEEVKFAPLADTKDTGVFERNREQCGYNVHENCFLCDSIKQEHDGRSRDIDYSNDPQGLEMSDSETLEFDASTFRRDKQEGIDETDLINSETKEFVPEVPDSKELPTFPRRDSFPLDASSDDEASAIKTEAGEPHTAPHEPDEPAPQSLVDCLKIPTSLRPADPGYAEFKQERVPSYGSILVERLAEKLQIFQYITSKGGQGVWVDPDAELSWIDRTNLENYLISKFDKVCFGSCTVAELDCKIDNQIKDILSGGSKLAGDMFHLTMKPLEIKTESFSTFLKDKPFIAIKDASILSFEAITSTFTFCWASLFVNKNMFVSISSQILITILSYFGFGLPATILSFLLTSHTITYFHACGLKLHDYTVVVRERWHKLYDYFGWEAKGNFFEVAVLGTHFTVTFGIVAASAAGLFKLASMWKSTKVPTESGIDIVEQKSGCGPSVTRRNAAKILENFGFWDTKPTKSSCTGSPTEIEKKIGRNVRFMVVSVNGFEHNGFLTGVCKDYAITSGHYFSSGDSFDVTVWKASSGQKLIESVNITISKSDITPVGDDTVIFRIPQITFCDVRDHIGVQPFGKHGEVLVAGQLSIGSFSDKSIVAEHVDGSRIKIKSHISYPKGDTTKGSCGLPVLFRKDSGSAWCGIHSAGDGKTGYASVLDKTKICAIVNETPILCQSLSETYHSSVVTDEIDTEMALTQPNAKSPFCYNTFENLRFLGKCPSVRACLNQKSGLVVSELSKQKDFVEIMFCVFLEYMTVSFGRPMMSPKMINGVYLDPYSQALVKSNKPKCSLDSSILKRVVSILTEHVLVELKKVGINSLNPLTAEFAINGMKEDQYLRRISASTSAGFGLDGVKGDHLPLIDDFTRVMTPELEQLLCNVIESYARGEKVGFVYTAALKDEPREISKCYAGKTRVFYVSPLPLVILQRMFLAPFYTLMVQHSAIFGAALGTDMHSEGHVLYEALKNFSDLWMEGDYGGFDLQMPFEIGQGACTVVRNVLSSLGYNEAAMSAVNGLLSESLHPVVEMNGDIYTVPALQPSGKYATAEDNSLRGLIMMMYAWYSNPDLKDKDFFAHVMPLLYGDDMLAAVLPSVSDKYNNLTYSKFVEEKYKMEFTSASKEAVLTPFVSPDKASFLKRKWVDHAVLSHKVAALDINSIYKMLTWYSPSKVSSLQDQTIDTFDSALRETFFHVDEKRYDVMRGWLIQHCETRWNLGEKAAERFPVWASLVDKFTIVTESEVVRKTVADLTLELDELKVEKNEFEGRSYFFVRQSYEFNNFPRVRQAARKHFANVSRVQEITAALEQFKESERERESAKIRTQSEVVMSKGPISGDVEEKHENVIDVGGSVPDAEMLGSPIDFSRPTSLQPSDFFERPIRIATLSVALGSDVTQALDVWELLSLDPSVRSKFRNYSLMRADIEVTIETAASPFHYARLMVAYIPKIESNEYASQIMSAPAAYRFQKLQYLSQTRGCKVVDFRENKPLKYVLPFINYQPFCRLYVQNSATALGSGTAVPDLSTMGTLFVYSLNPLAASNSSAATSATVYVYARFVNVSLAALTASQTVIATESRSEMKTGPIEKTMSSLATVSNAVATVPMFRPWAQASGMIFSGLARFSALFGWSVPRVDVSVDRPMIVRNEPYHNNAVTVSRSAAQKIAFDPKQEISVDPRIVGVEEDELAIEYMCSIVSLLDQFQWSVSSVPMSTLLWSTAIVPNANKLGPLAAGNRFIQPTALSFCSTPFDFWCGEIELIFDFVVSSLHRGKVLIQVEPNISQYALVITNFQLNKEYSLVVDLQETQRVAICVPWMQPRQWLRVPDMIRANRSLSSTLDPSILPLHANGFLTVTPFTTLQSPDGSPITCNVYIRGKNMRFNQYDDTRLPTERIFTQSGTSFPEDHTCHQLGESVLDVTCQTTLCFGEQPLSFRSYLKRYSTTSVASVISPAVGSTYSIRPTIYPPISPAFGTSAVRVSLLSYLRYAFLGMSGGFRHRIGFQGARFHETDILRVSINAPSSSVSSSLVPFAAGLVSVADPKGTVNFLPSTQGGIEVELPMYSNNFFFPSGLSTDLAMKNLTSSDTNFDRFYTDTFSVQASPSLLSSLDSISFVIDSGTAEDFTLYRWIAAPGFRTNII